MSLVPYVIEQTSRGERSDDIYSRLLKDRKPWRALLRHLFKIIEGQDHLFGGRGDRCVCKCDCCTASLH